MCGNCCSSPIRDSPHRFLCSKRSKAVRLTGQLHDNMALRTKLAQQPAMGDLAPAVTVHTCTDRSAIPWFSSVHRRCDRRVNYRFGRI